MGPQVPFYVDNESAYQVNVTLKAGRFGLIEKIRMVSPGEVACDSIPASALGDDLSTTVHVPGEDYYPERTQHVYIPADAKDLVMVVGQEGIVLFAHSSLHPSLKERTACINK